MSIDFRDRLTSLDIYAKDIQTERPKTLNELILFLQYRFQDIGNRFIGKPKTEELKYNLKYALEQEAISFIHQFGLFAIEDMVFGTIAEIIENNFEPHEQLKFYFGDEDIW